MLKRKRLKANLHLAVRLPCDSFPVKARLTSLKDSAAHLGYQLIPKPLIP
jgi:hypothetical protein